MRLSLNTELGEFKFNLSQTSIIYLLNLAQQLEDEGDMTIRGSADAAGETKDRAMPAAEIERKADVLPADRQESGKPAEEEPETGTEGQDFGKLLDEFEQKQKRRWNATTEIAGPPDGKYKGFLHIKCDHCGDSRGFNAKVPTDEYKCNICGGRTKLKGLRAVHVDCECGKHWKYNTNETAEVLTINCINCGQPVDTMLNSRRTAYISIGGGNARRNTGGTKIVAGRYKW